MIARPPPTSISSSFMASGSGKSGSGATVACRIAALSVSTPLRLLPTTGLTCTPPVWARFPAEAAQDFHGAKFIGRSADEAVRAGQVDDVGPGAIGQLASSGFLFDGDARVVGDFLAKAGESVEERGFAGVGIAGEGNGQRARY